MPSPNLWNVRQPSVGQTIADMNCLSSPQVRGCAAKRVTRRNNSVWHTEGCLTVLRLFCLRFLSRQKSQNWTGMPFDLHQIFWKYVASNQSIYSKDLCEVWILGTDCNKTKRCQQPGVVSRIIINLLPCKLQLIYLCYDSTVSGVVSLGVQNVHGLQLQIAFSILL